MAEASSPRLSPRSRELSAHFSHAPPISVEDDERPDAPLLPPPSALLRRRSREDLTELAKAAAPAAAPASAAEDAGPTLVVHTRRRSRDLSIELGIDIAEAARKAAEGGVRQEQEDPKPKLKRTALTWLFYMGPAYYSYLQALLGPIMPFLEDELKINYSTAGLHFSAFASGCVLCGLTGDFLTGRAGRKTMFWTGGCGLTLAALVLAVGRTVVLTVGSSLFMGWLGTFVLSTSTAGLSDKHFAHRSVVLAESLVFCCLFAYLAPIFVGASETYFPRIGWRLSIYVSLAFFGVVAALFGRVKWEGAQGERGAPASPHKAGRAEGAGTGPAGRRKAGARLPLSFWGYAAIVFLSCSHEWILIYWGSIHMEADLGLSKVAAATNMNFFLLAMTAGRVVGSRLAARFEAARMLVLFLAANLVGFVAFWLLRPAWLAVAGLVLAGLGMSNQYPFSVSLALGAVPKALTDSASSRLMFSGGAAVLFGSQGLGLLADRMDMRRAMVFPGLLILPAIPLAAILRARCSPGSPAAPPAGAPAEGPAKYHLLRDEEAGHDGEHGRHDSGPEQTELELRPQAAPKPLPDDREH
eukprot:tig00020780_g13822.t1